MKAYAVVDSTESEDGPSPYTYTVKKDDVKIPMVPLFFIRDPSDPKSIQEALERAHQFGGEILDEDFECMLVDVLQSED